MTLDQVAVSDDVDRAKVVATTEAEIRRHMIEDGEDPDAVDGPAVTVLPIAARWWTTIRTALSRFWQNSRCVSELLAAASFRYWVQSSIRSPATR
jgi:hypothetical protein